MAFHTTASVLLLLGSIFAVQGNDSSPFALLATQQSVQARPSGQVTHVEGVATKEEDIQEETSPVVVVNMQVSDLDVTDLSKEKLRALEWNLTNMIHEQALVVVNTTDDYMTAQDRHNFTSRTAQNVASEADFAHTKAAAAAGASHRLTSKLELAKARMDSLRNATEEANKTLQMQLVAYESADRAYQAALKPIPMLKGTVEQTQKEGEDLEDARDAAQKAADSARNNSNDATLRLQKEINELNKENEDLREVQEELDRPMHPVRPVPA
jgi:chromosome segregation ATPase